MKEKEYFAITEEEQSMIERLKQVTFKSNRGTPNPYRAFHTNFVLGGFGAEAQFRTRKMGVIADRSHIDYKKGKSLSKYTKRVSMLERMGF